MACQIRGIAQPTCDTHGDSVNLRCSHDGANPRLEAENAKLRAHLEDVKGPYLAGGIEIDRLRAEMEEWKKAANSERDRADHNFVNCKKLESKLSASDLQMDGMKNRLKQIVESEDTARMTGEQILMGYNAHKDLARAALTESQYPEKPKCECPVTEGGAIWHKPQCKDLGRGLIVEKRKDEGNYRCRSCGWAATQESRPLSRGTKVGCPLCGGDAEYR